MFAPAWLISLMIHATLLVLLTVAFRPLPRGEAEFVAARGNTLDPQDAAEERYLTEEHFEAESDTAPQSPTVSPVEPASPEVSTPETPAVSAPAIDAVHRELPDRSLAVAPVAALPTTPPVVNPTLTPVGSAPSPSASDRGHGQPAVRQGGPTRTSVFGVEGEGTTFVYVFDRSGSMGGAGRNPLRAAKIELLHSLESLDQFHQFQIIFYNERPTVFASSESAPTLVSGSDAAKLQARSFVNSIVADGGTQHEGALMQALRMRPDVVFFLTDGAQPELSAAQLARIRQANTGRTSINAVEFGLGPPASSFNFLTRLARDNGGKYAYVDISTLNTDD